MKNKVNDEITTKDGLLWRNNKVIRLPEADCVAQKFGYLYAEQLVQALENKDLTNHY
jgi:hypothetical protein